MSLAALIRSMADAGAPAEAIALAVEAIEMRDAETGRTRTLARERKRRQRERERDGHAAVTGQSRDEAVTERDTPLDKKAPQTPKELNPPTPINGADAPSMPPVGANDGLVSGGKQSEAAAQLTNDGLAVAGNGEDAPPKPKRIRKRAVGSRLKPDWHPPAIADLPLEFQTFVVKWPTGAYELVAEVFRNHWLSEGRAIGAKKDWLRTWCNWLYGENAKVLRSAKQGVDFSTGRGAGASPANAERVRREHAEIVAMQKFEPGCAKMIREALRKECGAQTYDGWLRPTLMGLDEGGSLVVSALSAFLLDWVETHYGARIRALAAEAEQRPVEIVWRVMRPPARKAA